MRRIAAERREAAGPSAQQIAAAARRFDYRSRCHGSRPEIKFYPVGGVAILCGDRKFMDAFRRRRRMIRGENGLD
jgi:hypothetical protein